jgi:hypothetical protein
MKLDTIIYSILIVLGLAMLIFGFIKYHPLRYDKKEPKKPKKIKYMIPIYLDEEYMPGNIYYQIDEEYPFSNHITIDVNRKSLKK